MIGLGSLLVRNHHHHDCDDDEYDDSYDDDVNQTSLENGVNRWTG